MKKRSKGHEALYVNFETLLNRDHTTAYRVAKDTEIPGSTFSDWKNGRSTPKIEKLAKLAEYFQVPIEYFLKQQI